MSYLLWFISLPFRGIGYVGVVGACLSGLWDIWQSINADRMVLTPLGELWYGVSPATLNVLQAGIQRGVHPAIWDPGVLTLLRLPAFVALFIIAALALLIAQLIYRPK